MTHAPRRLGPLLCRSAAWLIGILVLSAGAHARAGEAPAPVGGREFTRKEIPNPSDFGTVFQKQ